MILSPKLSSPRKSKSSNALSDSTRKRKKRIKINLNLEENLYVKNPIYIKRPKRSIMNTVTVIVKRFRINCFLLNISFK